MALGLNVFQRFQGWLTVPALAFQDHYKSSVDLVM